MSNLVLITKTFTTTYWYWSRPTCILLQTF